MPEKEKTIMTESITTENTNTEDTNREEFQVSGDNLLTKVRELIHQGNVRRVILRREDGSTPA